MPARFRKKAPDALAVLTLVATGLVISWPVLSGGYFTYLDNPAHLAEVYAAAFEARNGWSEVAFCGFPLTTLHSPLWYGSLSVLVGAGLPVGALYAGCLLFGFLAPPLALFYVARRRTGVLASAVLAYLLLIQRPAIVGVGSALGGMWTFYVATAVLILLIDRLSRPCRPGSDMAWIAALTGITLLTHLFAVVPLCVLALQHLWLSWERKRVKLIPLLCQIGAGAVGLIASAVYWLPVLRANQYSEIVPQNLSARMVAARLFLPADLFDLVSNRIPGLGLSDYLHAIPLVTLVGLGLAATVFLRHRKDDAPLSGMIMAVVVSILLFVIAPEFDVKFLGPASWRMLYFVRVGFAITAIPLLGWFLSRPVFGLKRPVAVAASILAVLAGLWWGGPLASVVPARDGEEMAEVRALWRWVRDNRSAEWGRLYLQDTFDRPRKDLKLSQSHVLVLTSHETGARQLGATYGVAPYRTATWTASEFRTLFRRFVWDEEDIKYIRMLSWSTNCTHLVVSDPGTAARLLDSGHFELLHLSGRFRVLRVLDIESEWAAPLAGGDVGVEEFETGRAVLTVGESYESGDVLVKTSYHPNWRIKGATGARLEPDGSGLILVVGTEPGPVKLQIEYLPSSGALWMSLVGWVLVLGMCFFARSGD